VTSESPSQAARQLSSVHPAPGVVLLLFAERFSHLFSGMSRSLYGRAQLILRATQDLAPIPNLERFLQRD
jgi:hypothetical protein